MLKAIIFDLDGLLVDSQPLLFESYNTVFTKYGYPLTKKDWRIWIHKSWGPIEWIKFKKLPLEPLVLRAEKKEIYEKLIKTKLKFKPGAKSLINKLFKRYPLSIASASRIESVNLALKKFNIKSKFKYAISDVDIKRGKPFPDIFLKAAKLMSLKPEECLVFEDSIAGLKAAKSAGMKCIVCPDKFSKIDKKEFKNADKIVDSLKDVTIDMIKKI